MQEHDDKYCFFVAVDAVVFTVIRGKLNVLLIQNKFPPYEKAFALPGGRVRNTESPEDAVIRELNEETNVSDVFLKRYQAYAEVDRDPRNRVVSIAYMALIDYRSFSLEATKDAMSAQWVEVEEIETLAYDHNKILNDAVDALKIEIQTTNIAYQLLPEEFTLKELKLLYESVLGREFDKRNFHKRIHSLEILKDTGRLKQEGRGRPARLYQFKDKDYMPIGDRISVLL